MNGNAESQAVDLPDRDIQPVYATAFVATVAMLIIIPLQILVFFIEPMPESTEEWFALLNDKPLLGMFHTDFFLMVNNALMVLIYLAFYHSLKHRNRALLQIALTLGLVGIAAYLSSNKTFELFRLAGEYAALSGPADAGERTILLAAGKVMLLGWQGTAFDAYYVLNGITLVLVSKVMIKDHTYGKATGLIGLVAGFFMVVPSTAGNVGLVFSLLSLIPWYVFALRFSLVFRKLSQA